MIDADDKKPVAEPNRVPVDLVDDGFLWLINRAVFHPRGFALGIVFEPDGTTSFEVLGNGDEPWRFEGIDEDAKFRAVEAAFERVRADVQHG